MAVADMMRAPRAGRTFARVAVGLLLALPAIAGVRAPVRAETPPTILPTEMCRGVFIVSVVLEGASFDLLFDTGSSWHFLDPNAVANRLGRKIQSRKLAFSSARIGALDLGPIKARLFSMKTLSLSLGRSVDGILGFAAFRDSLLTLDYPAGEMRAESGQLPDPDGMSVFRDVGGKRPWIELRLGGRELPFQIDSGATPGHLQVRSRDRVRWAVEPRPARVITLFAGSAVDRGGRLGDALELGSARLEKPVAFVADRDRQFGWEVMRHFSWTFDQRRDRIRIERPAGPSVLSSPPLVRRGFGVRPRPDGLEVIRVLAGTPAERAGLRAGDVVTAIDGVPVEERGCGEPLGSSPGTPVEVTIIRDGRRSELSFETATLIP